MKGLSFVVLVEDVVRVDVEDKAGLQGFRMASLVK